MIVGKVPDGMTFEQVIAGFQPPPNGTPVPGAMTRAEFHAVGGIEIISPGNTAWSLIDLSQPGTYAVVCLVPDRQSGMLHVAEGMASVFTVGGAAGNSRTIVRAKYPSYRHCESPDGNPSGLLRDSWRWFGGHQITRRDWRLALVRIELWGVATRAQSRRGSRGRDRSVSGRIHAKDDTLTIRCSDSRKPDIQTAVRTERHVIRHHEVRASSSDESGAGLVNDLSRPRHEKRLRSCCPSRMTIRRANRQVQPRSR